MVIFVTHLTNISLFSFNVLYTWTQTRRYLPCTSQSIKALFLFLPPTGFCLSCLLRKATCFQFKAHGPKYTSLESAYKGTCMHICIYIAPRTHSDLLCTQCDESQSSALLSISKQTSCLQMFGCRTVSRRTRYSKGNAGKAQGCLQAELWHNTGLQKRETNSRKKQLPASEAAGQSKHRS